MFSCFTPCRVAIPRELEALRRELDELDDRPPPPREALHRAAAQLPELLRVAARERLSLALLELARTPSELAARDLVDLPALPGDLALLGSAPRAALQDIAEQLDRTGATRHFLAKARRHELEREIADLEHKLGGKI